jgi:hypothetical protein
MIFQKYKSFKNISEIILGKGKRIFIKNTADVSMSSATLG